MVERRAARTFGRIYEDKFASFWRCDLIPKTLIGQPIGTNAGPEYQGICVPAERLLGALVIGGGINAWLRRKRRRKHREGQG